MPSTVAQDVTARSQAVDARLTTLERRGIAGASWRDFGAVITVRDWDEAAALSDRIAPEHLELCVTDPGALAARCRHAGAIFMGGWTPEAAGDYVSGPNHVLPTARSARFSSGLSVIDFMKRTTLSRLTPGALAAIHAISGASGTATSQLAAMIEGCAVEGRGGALRVDRGGGQAHRDVRVT